jgi:hypothetical protein
LFFPFRPTLELICKTASQSTRHTRLLKAASD